MRIFHSLSVDSRQIYRLALAVLVVAVLMWCAVGEVQAQIESGDTASASRVELRWFDHFIGQGGWITWFVLLPLSVATVALSIEHAVSIRRDTLVPQIIVDETNELLAEKRYVDSVKLVAEDQSMLAYALHAALIEAGNGFACMERALEEAIEERSAKLMRKLEAINTIGNISPMIGLFGTVYGMIRLFASIGAAGELPSTAIIADDISIALVTTFWGVAIAIPALAIFAMFRNRVDGLTVECAITADRILAVFKPGAAASAMRPAAIAPAAPAAAAAS
ncbi:MAG: MotA/TolQ/ExbB proton channel family protein [Planctomycetes bacterium]|nr:MotA/TolQ/ExbB proton channel family protein [Planctomycetota bacterium]